MATAFGQSAGSLALDSRQHRRLAGRPGATDRPDADRRDTRRVGEARRIPAAAARACRVPGTIAVRLACAKRWRTLFGAATRGRPPAGGGVGGADAMEPGRMAPSCAHQPPDDGRRGAGARAPTAPIGCCSRSRSTPRTVAVRRPEPVTGLRRRGMRLVLLRSQQGRPAALVQHGGVRQPRQGAVVSRAGVP